jgi:Fic family protein
MIADRYYQDDIPLKTGFQMLFAIGRLPAEYLQVIQKIDLLRNQLRYNLQQQPRRWTGLLSRSTFARNIQASNSIEGYNVTFDDAIAAVEGEDPIDEKSEAWMAVNGYRTALSYILQLADDPYYVHNEGTIRSLHYMMIAYDVARRPGRWRPGSIFVRREPSGEIVYEGPDVALVPSLMSELVASLNEASDLPVMIRAAMAHLNLVMIHPFSDGNGRMGRALQTMVLSREGILDPRFSSIEEYLGDHVQEYYAVLAQVGRGSWRPENDSLPWVRFCLTAHFRQAERLLRRTKETERLWAMLEHEAKRRRLNERMMMALMDAAQGQRVRNSTYRSVSEVSDEVASKDLRALVEHKLLVPQGERRGRFYIAGDWLKSLRNYVREPRTVTDPFSNAKTVSPARGDDQAFLPGFAPD